MFSAELIAQYFDCVEKVELLESEIKALEVSEKIATDAFLSDEVIKSLTHLKMFKKAEKHSNEITIAHVNERLARELLETKNEKVG